MSKQNAPRVQNVRTPGAPSAEADEPKATLADLAAEQDALEADLLGGDTQLSDDTVEPAPAAAALAPDLQALIAAEVAKGIAKERATLARAQAAAAPQARELPDQSEVDAFTIKSDVLTKQGIVVPVAYPQAFVPNALR